MTIVFTPPPAQALDGDAPVDPTTVVTRQQFADMLVRLREQAGLTVREVAKASGIPFSTIGSYMAGRHLPPGRPEVLRDILGACGVADRMEIQQWWRALLRVRRSPGPRPTVARVPYTTLAGVGAEDGCRGYGRQRLTQEVCERMVECWSAGGGIVAVTGASGSGKSVLLHGGVIPALRRGEMPLRGSQGWPVLQVTPDTRPLLALAYECAKFTGAVAADVAADLRVDPARGRDLVGKVGAAAGSQGVVVVVDQFEDVSGPGVDELERQAFFAVLRALSAPAAPASASTHGWVDVAGPPPAIVVLVPRLNAYQRTLRELRLHQVLQRATVTVGPMAEPELREAIVAPVYRAGLDIDDGLVELLLRDVAPPAYERSDGAAHEIGALPLLSLTLAATWEQSARRRMTVAAYREAGGFHGVTARTADRVFESVPSGEQDLTRRLLLRLVRIRSDGTPTRRQVAPSDLTLVARRSERRALAAMMDLFVKHRLITVGAGEAWLTHEAVLTAWPRLRGWIEAKPDGLQVRQWLRAIRSVPLPRTKPTQIALRG